MSETNAPEPTMEEILASIRRIISEDDAPAAAADAAPPPGDPPRPVVAEAPPAPPAPSAHQPEPEPAPLHEDVLELTERVPEPAAAVPEALGDIDFADGPSAPAPEAAKPATPPPPPAPAPRPAPTAASAPPPREEPPLVGAGAAGRAADHFGALASSMSMPASGRTLEDVVRELLRPLLKEWLDQHLATIVEARVQDEVERISRRRTY